METYLFSESTTVHEVPFRYPAGTRVSKSHLFSQGMLGGTFNNKYTVVCMVWLYGCPLVRRTLLEIILSLLFRTPWQFTRHSVFFLFQGSLGRSIIHLLGTR